MQTSTPGSNFFHRTKERLALKPLGDVRAMMRSAFPCPNRTTRVPVAASAGQVTARAVHSPMTVPATDTAARDGFAVISAETRGADGSAPIRLRNPHRVNTGNAVPRGYDAVVMIEDIAGEDGAWSTKKAVAAGEHIHPAGSEIEQGERILPAGHRIRPCDIGALLTYGIADIDVLAVKVGLIPTGSELVPAGGHPGAGEVIESNTAVAAAWLCEAGASPTRYGIVADDPAALRQAIAKAVRENDLVLISAGSSTGTRDFTAGVIGELGDVLVHGIAMKPGRPAIVGRVEDKPVIGMPGYPIAALTTIRELALPLLAEWGFCTPPAERLRARLREAVLADPEFDEFILLTVYRAGDGYTAVPLPPHARTQMAMVRANACLHVPAGTGDIPEGAEVDVFLTGPCAPVTPRPRMYPQAP